MVILKKKKRVTLTIDADLALEHQEGEKLSRVLNDTLRAMSDTHITVPYYARQLDKYSGELAEINNSLERVGLYLDPALKTVETYLPRREALIKRREAVETQLAKIREELEVGREAERKLQLTIEINSAIRRCEYIQADVERAVSKQLKELKKLVPSFNLEKQIELIKQV